MSIDTTWVVVPVRNDIDLSDLMTRLDGSFVAPETYEVTKGFNHETGEPDVEVLPHPYFGQAAPSFAGRIVFIDDNGNTYPGVTTLTRDHETPNISADWNLGIDYAKANGASYILVLSGPNLFDPFMVPEALDAIDNAPSDVLNIADGVAWMIDADSIVRPDEQFRIWFAANDVFRQAGDLAMYRCAFAGVEELDPMEVDSAITEQDHANYDAKWA